MTYRIVVATDFSAPSTYALEHALALLTRIPDGELHLAHVVVSDASDENLADDERFLSEALGRMRAAVAQVGRGAAAGGTRIERDAVFHVRFAESAARTLEQVALDVGADLVVVGTHHRKGIDRLVLGSVAEDLLRGGRVAILVARPPAFEGMQRGALDAERADVLTAFERVAWTAPKDEGAARR